MRTTPILRSRTRRLAAVTLIGLVGSLAVFKPASGQSWPASNWQPELIKRESLFGGASVRLTYDEGIVVVAGAGTRVKFTQQTTTGKGKNAIVQRSIGLIPPDVTSQEQMVTRAAVYKASGRSSYNDAIAAGYSAEQAGKLIGNSDAGVQGVGDIWDSGCVGDSAGSRIRWDGYYRRYVTADSDPSAYYSAEESNASGEGSFWYYLTKGKTEHRYRSGNQIVQWQPGSDRSVGKCVDTSIGMSAYGVSLSMSGAICPSRWNIHWARNLFYNQWEDSWGSAGNTVEALAQTFAKVPNGYSTGFEYWIGWAYNNA